MEHEHDRENRDKARAIHRNRIAAILAETGHRIGYQTQAVAAEVAARQAVEAAESQTIDSEEITATFRPAGYLTRELTTKEQPTPAILRCKPMTRRGVSSDWESIWNLDQLCYPGDPWSMNEIHGLLIQANLDPEQRSIYFRPTHFLVFADMADQPIGYVAYRVFAGYARIDRLGVHPQCRTKGVGTILLDAMVEAIAEMNSLEAMMALLAGEAEATGEPNFLRAIHADIWEREVPAQKFLAANGFRCQEPFETTVRHPATDNPLQWGKFERGDSVYPFIRILDGAGK